MARAGFTAVGGGPIEFRRDGRWYSDGDVIENAKIELLFSRHVRSDGEGGWVIDVGIDCQPVEVEDTALVVKSVDGSPERGFDITANDGVTEALPSATLSVGEGGVLYCEVDRGERGIIRARFLRPAYYHLMQHAEERDDRIVLRSGECEARIG